ncbi:hypothetical protein JQX13_44870 [Archangium violaceum]|uniref:hypothetical protein n=1 Tax=Archangium violaceum TaxID=83451 RepID=UPI00193BA83F|nr:hypothetical protein [Archangium violaceum]QRK07114.1 hypothetical protein JQX13_44870 [Archangium violaceum]
MRLAVFGNGPDVLDVQDGEDDRVLIPFTILSEGTVRVDSSSIRSVYLDENCVEELVESIRFEPLFVRDVSVTWTLTFSTTAAERTARRTALASSFARVCEALTEGVPPGGGPPPEDYLKRSAQRLLALVPSLDPMVRRAAEAVASVNPVDRWTLFRAASKEYGLEAHCPAVEWLAQP